jgi:hypothetical protein
MRRLIPSVVSCVLLSGCFGPSEGVEVPVAEIYFPVGLALDQGDQHLFVVSSDFDLQFNAGAIQSYDTGKLLRNLPVPANDAPGGLLPAPDARDGLCVNGERSAAERLVYPGVCNPFALTAESSVKIGAFATDAILRQTENGPQRLFVPVRGDSTLHWLDIDGDGRMQCGQSGNGGACDAQHRAGDDPTENTRDITLNVEPFGVDASEHGENIVVSNQTTGTASLFVTDRENPSNGPQLKFALPIERVRRPVGVAALPRPAAQGDVRDGDTFLMTFRDSAQVRVLRVHADDSSAPDRPFLVDGGGVGIAANSVGSDSRGIAVDTSARKAAEKRCAGDEECLTQAALVPLDVYVANRSPASLLIGRTNPPQEYPSFFDSVPLTVGPSHVAIGKVRTAAGELETRVFVACFDSRRVFVYDPGRARIETEIFTGRGPHAMVVDETRALLYVGHFTDSYVGVYSLDLGFPLTYGSMLGTLGAPKPPRSSK